MKKKLFYFLNFKMYLPSLALFDFLRTHKEALITLAKDNHANIILAPGEINLASSSKLFDSSPIKLAGQNSALKQIGAYTGQTSAQSLAELDVFSCLVGHSEVRNESKRTNQDFAEQAIQLLELGIAPVFCIGESEKEKIQGKTKSILKSQLLPLQELIDAQPGLCKNTPLFIAYEPLWAIGSNNTPSKEELSTTLQWLNNEIKKISILNAPYLMYGGNVNSKTIENLKAIPNIDGFLIGRASCDFQEFKKVVEWDSSSIFNR